MTWNEQDAKIAIIIKRFSMLMPSMQHVSNCKEMIGNDQGELNSSKGAFDTEVLYLTINFRCQMNLKL
jgi:hypothetical protein